MACRKATCRVSISVGVIVSALGSEVQSKIGEASYGRLMLFVQGEMRHTHGTNVSAQATRTVAHTGQYPASHRRIE